MAIARLRQNGCSINMTPLGPESPTGHQIRPVCDFNSESGRPPNPPPQHKKGDPWGGRQTRKTCWVCGRDLTLDRGRGRKPELRLPRESFRPHSCMIPARSSHASSLFFTLEPLLGGGNRDTVTSFCLKGLTLCSDRDAEPSMSRFEALTTPCFLTYFTVSRVEGGDMCAFGLETSSESSSR